MSELLPHAFIYLFAAVIAVPLSKRLGLGSVLGYLIAGILIGPLLGLVGAENLHVQHVAEFGVVMMLFLVGLELEPRKLWQMREKLLGLGGLQVLVTTAAIAAVGMALGLHWGVAVAAGCVLSSSSTAIVLQTLDEKHLMHTPGGQGSFGVLLFQDIAVIPMLALLPLLAQPELIDHATAYSAQQGSNLFADLHGWPKALLIFAVIASIIIGGHYLASPVFRYIAQARLREIFTLFSLALVVGIAVLMSLIGLSPALGTFLAGVVLANSEYRHELESNIEPFKGLLLGIFFITVGAAIDFSLLFQHFGTVLALTLGVMLLKALVLWALARLFRLPRLDSLLFALALAQAGEFGFVLLSFLVSNAIMPEDTANLLLLVVTLSMLLTPLCFLLYDRVLAPRAYRAAIPQSEDAIDEHHPVLIIGHGRFGQIINSLLSACDYKTTVIDYDPAMVAGFRRYGVKTYFGDASRPELLMTAGLADAQLLIVAIDHPEQTQQIVEFARRTNPGLKIVARARGRRETFNLYHAGADEIIRETFDSAIRSSRQALVLLGMEPTLAERISDFYFDRDRQVTEVLAKVYDPALGAFENPAMMVAARAEEATTRLQVQALMRGEEPPGWPQRQSAPQ